MAPLRVAMVNKLYPPWVGGMEVHLAQLARQLVASGQVDVRVIVGQEQRGRFVEELVDGVPVLRAATIARVARTPITIGLARLLRSVGADVYHFHSPYPWAEFVALGASLRAPIVVTWYHDIVRQRLLLKLYRPLLDRFLARAVRIVAWSPEALAGSPLLRRHAAKTTVIPGGIDTTPFVPCERSRGKAAALRRALAPSGPVILFVGRLVYYKGVDVLLRAMAFVPGTLVVVGRGPLDAELRTLAGGLGIAGRVRFAGGVAADDLPPYYQASDVLVLPSTEPTEAFGLVQIEAHASGIPSICTDLGTGTTFANVHGTTGLVVPPRDPRCLADALRQLICEPELRHRLGCAAQRRALAEFDVRVCAGRMLALYHDVTGAAPCATAA